MNKGAAMGLAIEALQAVGLVVGVGVVIFVTPLLFVLLFSLVSGFPESTPDEE